MGCEGLLKHLANIKVLRHQIVNSASFLLVNWRQCFPSSNSWSNQSISKITHSCAPSQGSTNSQRGGTPHNSWSRPSLDDKQFALFPSPSAVNCVLSSVSTERLQNFAKSENWTHEKAGRFERKKRICNPGPQFAAGLTIRNQWLINPGLQEPSSPHTAAPTWGWLHPPFYAFPVLVNGSQMSSPPSLLPNKWSPWGPLGLEQTHFKNDFFFFLNNKLHWKTNLANTFTPSIFWTKALSDLMHRLPEMCCKGFTKSTHFQHAY